MNIRMLMMKESVKSLKKTRLIDNNNKKYRVIFEKTLISC